MGGGRFGGWWVLTGGRCCPGGDSGPVQGGGVGGWEG